MRNQKHECGGWLKFKFLILFHGDNSRTVALKRSLVQWYSKTSWTYLHLNYCFVWRNLNMSMVRNCEVMLGQTLNVEFCNCAQRHVSVNYLSCLINNVRKVGGLVFSRTFSCPLFKVCVLRSYLTPKSRLCRQYTSIRYRTHCVLTKVTRLCYFNISFPVSFPDKRSCPVPQYRLQQSEGRQSKYTWFMFWCHGMKKIIKILIW
jgi:hypothetical protein